MSFLIWVSDNAHNNTKPNCLKIRFRHVCVMIKESVCVRDRKGERGTEIERFYFPWVYLLTRFVPCFSCIRGSAFLGNILFSCSSGQKLLISFPGISSIQQLEES